MTIDKERLPYIVPKFGQSQRFRFYTLACSKVTLHPGELNFQSSTSYLIEQACLIVKPIQETLPSHR